MISHKPNQVLVSVRSRMSIQPLGHRPDGAGTTASGGIGDQGIEGPRWGVEGPMLRGTAAEAAVRRNGPISVECSEQDRFQGTGLRAGSFPHGREQKGLLGALWSARAGHTGDGCRRTGPFGPIRAADRGRGPISPDSGRHVVLRAWGRDIPEARSGRTHNGDRFYPRAYGHHLGGGLRRARTFLSDMGAGTAARLWRGSAGAALEASAGGRGGPICRKYGMMAGPGGESSAGGGPARHIPVLLDEVLAALGAVERKTVIDGTFGASGYTAALLERGASVIAIDRD